MARLDRLVAGSAAGFLLVFGFLPLANWIPGGLSAPWYGAVGADLLTGLGIAVGVGIVAAILLRKATALWREGRSPLITRYRAGWIFGIALVALGLYFLAARAVFSGRPLLIDEIIEVFQARLLAAGHLWLPAAKHQVFFGSLHLVEQDGRVYGQFPFGGPAMLALGTLAGGEWLVGPLFGAISVVAFGALVRRIEPRPATALGATALFALAPFAVFMSGSHMNHGTALCWLVTGMGGLARATADEGRPRDGLLAGLAFGVAATIRPIDALAFALPAGIWLVLRTAGAGAGGGRDRRRIGILLAAGLGMALPLLGLAWVNLRTTGSPFRFGYSVLWGPAHGLGFHASPWGPVHTPARGLELINLYFLRLQSYLFETAAPSLLPAAVAFALTRRLRPFDRYLIASGALLVGLYFAYWHDGFYLGPRFMYPLLPLLALWTARFPAALRERVGAGFLYRVSIGSIVVAVGLGLATAVPLRIRQYRGGMLSLRWDADGAAKAARVSDALVLVRESWGAELVARLWGLGVSRPDADAIYRSVDPCRLDLALAATEHARAMGEGIDGAAVTRRLQPLLRDSVRLVAAEAITGDPSLRLTAGMKYPPRCVEKIEANRSGFTLFPPLLLAGKYGNVYGRDLGGKDSLLLGDYPGRPVYLLKPESGAVGAEPVFHRLSADSLFRAWRAEASAP